MDTLTVMNEDVVPDVSSSNDHREVSQILWTFSRELTSQKHFWLLRYQVQEIGPLFHEQSQKAISTRLAVLNGIRRFDAKAILRTKVCQVVKELLSRVSELKQDKYRLRVQSCRLIGRLSWSISAHRRWQDRVRRELDALYDGYYMTEDGPAVGTHIASR